MKPTKKLMDFSLKNAVAVTILTLTDIEHSLASLQAFENFHTEIVYPAATATSATSVRTSFLDPADFQGKYTQIL